MRAKVVPYSSTVGSSILLFEGKSKEHIAQLAIFHIKEKRGETHREASEKIAAEIAAAINERADAQPR